MCAFLCCTVSGKVLHDMMSGSSAGSAPLSVDIGRHLPSNMYNPIPTILASYWHIFLSSTLYDSVLARRLWYISAAEVGGRVRGSTCYVPLEILSHNRLYCTISSPSSLAPPYNDTRALSPAIIMPCFACPH